MVTQITFDALEWIARFEAVGGAYALTDDHLHLWIIPDAVSDRELSMARVLVTGLAGADREALVEHLRFTAMVEG